MKNGLSQLTKIEESFTGKGFFFINCFSESIRNRRRVCDNPPPKGGAYCPGDDTETTPCVGCPGMLHVFTSQVTP